MYLSYTGGTTGLPKGVMYEMRGVTQRTLDTRAMICGVEAPWEAEPATVAVDLARRGRDARRSAGVASDAQHRLHVPRHSRCSRREAPSRPSRPRRFDPSSVLATVERARATVVAIVGDAFGRPLVQALDDACAAGRPFDVSPVRVVCSAGVAWSADTKRRLLDHLPGATLLDACGSTEGGTYGFTVVRRGDDPTTARFTRAPGTVILRDDGQAEVPIGETGLIAALTQTTGYYKQPEKTAETFRTIDGQQYVVPGDLGRIEPDGSITLLGRGTSVINTGGEKVHPEEVEDVLKALRGVIDAIVVGVPDERLGQVVGAVLQLAPGARASQTDVATAVRQKLAGYKAPRRIVFVDEIPRAPNGKADLARARDLAGAADAIAAP